VPISDQEVATVLALVKSGFPSKPWPYPEVGERVRIRFGALQGLEGILVAAKRNYRLVVSVGMLQRSVAVEVDAEWVEPLRLGESIEVAA